MNKTLLLTLVGITIGVAACERHHEQEDVVIELIKGNNSITDIMLKHESTNFYKDSILKTVNADTLWSEIFAKFTNNYIIEEKGYWFDKWYYQKYIDVDSVEVDVITVVNDLDSSEIIEFHFKQQNGKWKLISIDYKTQ